MSDIILSDKEKKLFDFVKNSEVDITIEKIEKELGMTYVGALGKLLCLKIVSCEKRNLEVIEKDYNKYGYKWTKCFFVKEEVK